MTQTDNERLRIGVVGCGSIARLAHLPNLAALQSRFALCAVADPDSRIAARVAARYRVPSYGTHRELLRAQRPDALLIASPHAYHASAILDAVQAGVPVFVEKPLCVTVEEADEITALAAARKVVVQVGYMKRHDDAYQALVNDLQHDESRLLYVSALTTEGRDLPLTFAGEDAARTPAGCAGQHSSASPSGPELPACNAPAESPVYTGLFLADLVHDVNLLQGVLRARDDDVLGEPRATWWNEGRAGIVEAQLAGGGAATISYVEVPGGAEYDEHFVVVTEAARYDLSFPPPYLHRGPTLYERRRQSGPMLSTNTARSYAEPFMTELEAFHRAVVDEARCVTPAADARWDIWFLQNAFLRGLQAPADTPADAMKSAGGRE